MNLNAGTTIIYAVSLAVMIALTGCQEATITPDVEQLKQVAGELRDHDLYSAAIDEYRRILDRADLDDEQRGNINYLIARVYFEDLKDYSAAAAYYIRARAYNPNGSYMTEASRNLVASLEKLGQFVDARRELGAAANLDGGRADSADVPVALIGADTVWRSSMEGWIQTLPPQMQQGFTDAGKKSEFLRQYVGAELLYRAALREGYDRDPEIISDRERLFRSLLVDRFIVDKVMPDVRIDTVDVRNYFEANRAARYGDAPYDSVRTQVFMDYQAEKAGTVYSDYISRLAQAQKVTFLDHNLNP